VSDIREKASRTHSKEVDMECRKVNAIIRSDVLERVEERLRNMGVRGISVSHVKGFGEYANFFKHNWLVRHARIEIFAERSRAEEIARVIVEAAHTGVEGDGIVAILPVEKVIRIRTQTEESFDDQCDEPLGGARAS
jgi:nitrogen regulatory protein P-II 1